MEFTEHPLLVFIVLIFSIPIYLILAELFFGKNYKDLGEALHHLFTPDFISLLRGEFLSDQWHTMKFWLFLLICAGWVAAVSEMIARYFL